MFKSKKYHEACFSTLKTGPHRQVVSKCMRVSATKMESEKVTNMVGTFLAEDSNSFYVPTMKMALEKVANMMATFLNGTAAQECSNGFQVPTTKTEPER